MARLRGEAVRDEAQLRGLQSQVERLTAELRVGDGLQGFLPDLAAGTSPVRAAACSSGVFWC